MWAISVIDKIKNFAFLKFYLFIYLFNFFFFFVARHRRSGTNYERSCRASRRTSQCWPSSWSRRRPRRNSPRTIAASKHQHITFLFMHISEMQKSGLRKGNGAEPAFIAESCQSLQLCSVVRVSPVGTERTVSAHRSLWVLEHRSPA